MVRPCRSLGSTAPAISPAGQHPVAQVGTPPQHVAFANPSLSDDSVFQHGAPHLLIRYKNASFGVLKERRDRHKIDKFVTKGPRPKGYSLTKMILWWPNSRGTFITMSMGERTHRYVKKKSQKKQKAFPKAQDAVPPTASTLRASTNNQLS